MSASSTAASSAISTPPRAPSVSNWPHSVLGGLFEELKMFFTEGLPGLIR